MFSTVSSPAEPNAHQLYKTLLDYDKKLRKRIKSLFNRCSNYLIPRASQLALRVSALIHSYAGRHVKAIAVKAYYSCLRKKFRVRFLLRHFSMHKIGFNQDVKAKGGRWTRKTKFHSNVLLPRVRPWTIKQTKAGFVRLWELEIYRTAYITYIFFYLLYAWSLWKSALEVSFAVYCAFEVILAVLQLTLAAATTACLLLLGTARALGFLLSILLSVASRLHTYFLLIGFSAKLALLHTKVKQLKPNLDVLELRDAWTRKLALGTLRSGYAYKTHRISRALNLLTSQYNVIRNLGISAQTRWLQVLLESSRLRHTQFVTAWSRAVVLTLWLLNIFKRSAGDGAAYLRGLVVLFAFDAMLTDDEPLWEPVEWSLVQSWILFIFAFAWIAENLISSRYGSYTGRDKRVWAAWYKTFWLIEGWYVLSLGAAALFVIVPFYHEISYTLPLAVSWWNWYSRVFFYKFVSVYSLVLYLAYYLQLNLGLFHWRKSLALILLINVFLSYLLYTHFLMSFFAYFTDPNWYSQTRLVDYVQLSHEPNKWSWGNEKRDHFSYHNSKTVLWFKNDGPFASAFLLFHIMFFLCLFALYVYWLTLFRKVYATREVTYTYTTYCVSALRQFFFYFLFLFCLVIFSFAVQYWRLPIEYSWIANTSPLAWTVATDLWDYPSFLLNILLG